jgi:hypothetical protein
MARIALEQFLQHTQSIAVRYETQLLELEERAYQSQDVQPIRQERELLLHQIRLLQLEPLGVKHAVHFAWFTIDELPEILTQRIQRAIEVLRLFIPQPREHPDFYLEVIHRQELPCELRYIKAGFAEVYVRSDAPTAVILHELGHWLEESVTGVKDMALKHLEPRVQNEEPRHLGLGYHALEYTQPDAFISPYTGKCKPDGTRVYTELISTGIEHLYENPIRLIQQDPQTAAFLLELLESL